MYTFFMDTCVCISSPSRYQFIWGDGDTTNSFDSWAGHAYRRSGAYSVRARVQCSDYNLISQLSAPHNLYAYKYAITEIPEPMVSRCTVYVADTILIPVKEIQCSTEILYSYYLNDIATVYQGNSSTFKFSFPETGLYSVRFSAWCDTVRMNPSPYSEPCIIVVLDKDLRAPRPFLMGDTISYTDTISSNHRLTYAVRQDSVNGIPCDYRFAITPGDTSIWSPVTLYTVNITGGGGIYTISAQARCSGDTLGDSESEWSYVKLKTGYW
jgi:hypothetical protein